MILEIIAGAAIGFLIANRPAWPRRKPRVVVWTHQPYTADQLREALSTATLDDPIFRALLQLIQEAIDSATSEVGALALADKPGALAHTAGGLEWLQLLQHNIERLVDAPGPDKNQD